MSPFFNSACYVLLVAVSMPVQSSASTPNVDCKVTSVGWDYVGNVHKVSVRQIAYSCQRWSLDMPHMHKFTDASYFPDDSMDNVSNYCRNPDKKPGGPWCFTTGTHRWGYCDVKHCSAALHLVAYIVPAVVAVLIAVLLLLVWKRRRDRKRKPRQPPLLDDDTEESVRPTSPVERNTTNVAAIKARVTSDIVEHKDMTHRMQTDDDEDDAHSEAWALQSRASRNTRRSSRVQFSERTISKTTGISKPSGASTSRLAKKISKKLSKKSNKAEPKKGYRELEADKLQATYLVLLKDLMDANASLDVYEIQRCLAAYESFGVVFDIDMDIVRQSREYLLVGKCRTDLYMAIREGDLGIIKHVIRGVQTNGLADRLWLELRVAQKVSKALTRSRKAKKRVTKMSRALLSQIRSYSPPPAVVHDVMMATLLVLGEPESLTQDWETCQHMCDTIGARQYQGLYTRIREFHIKNLHPEVAARALKRISPYRKKEIDALNTGVGMFYAWTTAVCRASMSLVHFTPREAKGSRQEKMISELRKEGDIHIVKEVGLLDALGLSEGSESSDESSLEDMTQDETDSPAKVPDDEDDEDDATQLMRPKAVSFVET